MTLDKFDLGYEFNKTQVQQYLDRIKFFGSSPNADNISLPSASLDTLNKIVSLHSRSMAFGSLTYIYYPLEQIGRPRNSIQPEDLFKKMVLNNREGYCFEQNILLYYVLKSLQFDVHLAQGRMVNLEVLSRRREIQIQGSWVPPAPLQIDNPQVFTTHYNTKFKIELDTSFHDQSWGFKTYALMLKFEPSTQAIDLDKDLTPNQKVDQFLPIYYFNLIPCYTQDLLILNEFINLDTNSYFNKHVFLSKYTEQGCVQLLDDVVTIRSLQGSKKVNVGDEESRRLAIKNYFDINLPNDFQEHLRPIV